MRIIKFFSFFLAANTCLCAPREIHAQDKKIEDQKIEVLKKGSRIVLLGDSLAEGMAAPFLSLTKKCNYKGYVYALHSTKIDYWSKRIDKVMIDTRPALVIVSLGTNDSGISKPELQRPHVKKIVSSVKKHGSKILWLLPQQLPARFKSQDEIKKIITEESEIFLASRLETVKDQIHLTQSGYKMRITKSWMHLSDIGLLVRLPGVEPGNGAL